MTLVSRFRHATARRDRLVLMAVLAAGLVLMVVSLFLPEFRDEARAVQVINEDPPNGMAQSLAVIRDWHTRLDALRTPKFVLQDLGTGLCSFGVILLALTKWQDRSVSELVKTARTPRTPWWFLGLGAMAWGLAFASFVYLLCRDLERHEFPSWSDSIAIPMMGAGQFFPLALPLLLAIEFAFVFHAPLPVSLWHWDPDRPIRSWSWSILFGAGTFLLIFPLLSSLLDGDVLMILASGTGLYLFLSLRAAITARGASQP